MGSDDLAQIVCEYAKAIKLAPDMVTAYNNLALSRRITSYQIRLTNVSRIQNMPYWSGSDSLDRAP